MMEGDLGDFGWTSIQAGQLAAFDDAGVVPVRVMDVHRSLLHVSAPGIDDRIATPTSVDLPGITVGDWVMLDTARKKIVRLLERSSVFKRRAPGSDRREQLIAANVDTLFIVSSCNQDFSEARIERYLALGREAGVMSIVLLTKADLCDEPLDYVRRATRLAAGLLVEAINALDRETLRPLDAWLGRGQTIALLGSSGVGKSTLTNTLLGHQNVATQAVRADDDKGRHTTTARQLHRLPGGAWLLDTPGMRELQLTDVQAGLDDVFAEIAGLASDCRFADCLHANEPGCAVQAAIAKGDIDHDRVTRWRKLLREEAHNRESLAERRARDKSTGRLYRSIIDEAQRNKGKT